MADEQVVADKTIELTWSQKMQYRVKFNTAQQWASFVESLNEDLDLTNLDAVYEYLNTGQGLSEEYLNDMADNNTWINTVEYEVDDLVRLNADGVDEDLADDANG
jgi:hypothetical protein